MTAFAILIVLAFLFALLSLIPQTSSYPLLGVATLLICIALYVSK